MDLSQLRYFLAVLETGNFTKAAEGLSVSQPSLSMGIKRLEQELGVLLFDRDSRKVSLSKAGQLFAERARLILAQYEAALSDFRVIQERMVLRLGCLRSLRLSTVCAVIAALRERHPELVVEIHDGTVEELKSLLDSGQIDIALTTLAGQESPEYSRTLHRQRLLLAMRSDHPLGQQDEVTLTHLAEEPFIDRLHCELRQRRNDLMDCCGLSQQVFYRTDNEELVLSLLQSHLMVTIMPEWNDLINVIYQPVTGLDLARTLGLVWQKQMALDLNPILETLFQVCNSHMPSRPQVPE
jgi:DNA-binding transcriptional LysR family regulator